MTHATLLWSLWQSLLQSFASAFTRPGFRRFAESVTALALNVEEHTITQSVTAIARVADWKVWETFAKSGSWRADDVIRTLTRLIEKAPGRLWYGDHVSAVDDTKVHRCGEHVWGTCTFHGDTPRCPNRTTTVRAHNSVALGTLLENPGQPAWFLPISGRLSFRKSQWPARSGAALEGGRLLVACPGARRAGQGGGRLPAGTRRRTARACWTWSGCGGVIARRSSDSSRDGWEMRRKRPEAGVSDPLGY